MPEFLTVSMYMDNDTVGKCFNGNSAVDENNFLGIKIEDFKGRGVPFAPQSEGDEIALKKFARAHRAEYVQGPPAILLTIKIPANTAVQHFLARDIQSLDDRPELTVLFMKSVNKDNYPDMKLEVKKIDAEGESEELLSAGLAFFA